jgi:hypothetical protein
MDTLLDGYHQLPQLRALMRGRHLVGRNKGRNQVDAIKRSETLCPMQMSLRLKREECTCGVFDQKGLGPAERPAQGSPPERAEYAGSGRRGAALDRSADR